ncbi:hypothetical protein FOL46_008586 [Perkinsus olseni]|uniref:Uncharacterized protein n=1 Tax=Perkinsus olseni TaxID=32597 RepID=A0A7J6MWJ9_PEROL|nr:hypothetical protein FOL46_008586 [Perkinsus olseni]
MPGFFSIRDTDQSRLSGGLSEDSAKHLNFGKAIERKMVSTSSMVQMFGSESSRRVDSAFEHFRALLGGTLFSRGPHIKSNFERPENIVDIFVARSAEPTLLGLNFKSVGTPHRVMESPPELNLLILESRYEQKSEEDEDIQLSEQMGQTVEQLATISAASAADNSELSRNDPLFEAWDWTPSTVSSSTAGMPGLLPFIDFSPEGNSVEQPSAGQDGSLRELSNTIIHNGTLWEPNSLATPPLRKQRKSRARNGVPQLGEAGRAQLKSAISAAIRGENRKKMICREIGVLKSATIRQLILMANAIGLSHVVDDLVADFERVKEQKKILRPLKLTSCIRKRLSSKRSGV